MRLNISVGKQCLAIHAFFAVLILLFGGSISSFGQAQSVSANPPRPTNVKLVDEHSDGLGHIVRTVTFNQGNMKITQTIIMDKPVVFNTRVALNPDTMRKDKIMLNIKKSSYTVEVWYQKKMVRRYRAVFGPRPQQDKCMEGDRCTPEGIFTITNKNPASKYDKFLGISYPNDSAKVRFNRLKKAGSIPANASIGGNVGIHGIWPGGDDMIELGVGWTDGCIALRNKDIEELFFTGRRWHQGEHFQVAL